MDELSQLDELIESDILEALGQDIPQDIQKEKSTNITDSENESEVNEEEITLEDFEEESELSPEVNIENEKPLNEQTDNISVQNTKTIQNIDTTINTNDLGSLLSQLLTNKTIEITIKIKD